jgi:hypothetical protein
MRKSVGAALLLFTLRVSTALAASSKDIQQPDPEMLKMMEFLREMEMVKRMELLREMHQVESSGDAAKVSAPQKSAPVKKKETVK